MALPECTRQTPRFQMVGDASGRGLLGIKGASRLCDGRSTDGFRREARLAPRAPSSAVIACLIHLWNFVKSRAVALRNSGGAPTLESSQPSIA
jgi:hypothetical protein